MQQVLIRWLFGLLLLGLTASAAAQDSPAAQGLPADAESAIDADSGAALQIVLVTISPGDVYWQRFGHNAVLVMNSVRGEARLYNFGTFDFEQENFLLNFMRGRMLYRLSEGSVDRELAMYATERRGVTFSALDLSPDQRYAVAEMLAENALPENAEYRYDYFIDNCSTRVRDVIDRILSGSAQEQLRARSEGSTYRQLAVRHAEGVPWMAIGMDIGLGRRADRPLNFWEQSFIPGEFERFAGELKNPETQSPLVSERSVLIPAKVVEAPGAGLGWMGWTLLSALLSAAWYFASTRPIGLLRSTAQVLAITIQIGSALIGVALILLMTASEHSMAAANENVLLFAPTAVLLVPALWRLRRQDSGGGRFWAWFGVLLATFALLIKLDSAAQANSTWLAWLLPWHAALWFRVARPMD